MSRRRVGGPRTLRGWRQPTPDDLLATGSAALAAGQWAGARAAFEDALAREPTAEAHAGLADVLWWVGETQASVQHHERAYAAFRHRDDPGSDLR